MFCARNKYIMLVSACRTTNAYRSLTATLAAHCSLPPISTSYRGYASCDTGLANRHHDAHAQVISKIHHHLFHAPHLHNFVIVNALRTAYPNHYLVQTPIRTGLRAFAEAKLGLDLHADVSLDCYGGRRKNHDTEKPSLVKHLDWEWEFARLSAKWKGQDFFVYEATYMHNEWEEISNHYILWPKDQPGEGAELASETVDRLILAALKHQNRFNDEIWIYDCGWQTSKKLWKSVKESNWEDIVLAEELKQELMKNVTSFFDREDHYKAFGVPWKRGVILHGLPGNGKTITIKAMMRSLAQHPKQISTLYVKSLGLSCGHGDIRSIFNKAREAAPCLLVLEDLDSLVTQNVRSFFLNEVDGLESNNGILIVGSTNHLNNLDVAISKRPSRFDRKFHFPSPALTERINYCELWRSKLNKTPSLNFSSDLSTKIARASEGLSFAYLQEVFVSSLTSLLVDNEADAGRLIAPEQIWEAVNKQIEKIREEVQDSKKSLDDAARNSVVADALPGARRAAAGFGR